MKKLLALLLLALAATGCGEQPQRLESAADPAYQTDDWREQQRERTLRQSESTRIY